MGVLALAVACLRADGAQAAFEPLDTFGGLGSGAGRLAPGATGVALSPTGRVHVVDPANKRVVAFSPGGLPAGAFAGAGAGQARLTHPVGIAVDAAGSIWVTEDSGDRLHRFTADGVPTGTFSGRGAAGGSGEKLRDPRGVAIAHDGRVLVVDAANARVRVFAPSGAPLATWGGHGSGAGRFLDPDGIAVAPDGDVYVSDRARRDVQRFSASGAYLGALDGGGTDAGALVRPMGLAVDRDGVVHVADAGRDRVVSFAQDGATSWGAVPAFAGVTGLATDCRASVYVIDVARGLIHRFGRTDAPPPPCAAPAASFAATPSPVFVGDPVLLDASASADDGTITRWDWDLDGDGRFEVLGTTATLTRTFDAPGTLPVTLRVTDDDGQEAQARRFVTVTARPVPVPVPVPDIAPLAPLAVTPPPPAPREADAAPVPVPVRGKTMRAEVTQGTVSYRRPGSARSSVLTGSPLLPSGTRFDTDKGRVRLTLAVGRGTRTQSGVFWGSTFTSLQGTDAALTELVIDDDPAEERAAPQGTTARAAASRPKRTRSRLWGDAKGSFRTTGRNAVATVKGTRWLTVDDDAGTVVRVVEGVVSVRDTVTGQTVDVAAGDSYRARDACQSRRSFRIRLRVPVGVQVRSAEVEADGRRVRVVRRNGRLTSVIDLRGQPGGVQRVRIALVTTRGVRLVGTRTYRTCSGRLAGGAAPSI